MRDYLCWKFGLVIEKHLTSVVIAESASRLSAILAHSAKMLDTGYAGSGMTLL